MKFNQKKLQAYKNIIFKIIMITFTDRIPNIFIGMEKNISRPKLLFNTWFIYDTAFYNSSNKEKLC